MPTHAMSLDPMRQHARRLALEPGAPSIPIELVTSGEGLAALGEARGAAGSRPGAGNRHKARCSLSPARMAASAKVLFGTGGTDWAERAPMLTGVLPGALPAGDYRFAECLARSGSGRAGLSAGCYRFTRYKSCDRRNQASRPARGRGSRRTFWRWPRRSISGATSSTRRPTIWGPPSSKPRRATLANTFGASIKVTEGSNLLSDNFPMIHAVGRASDRHPRLIDMHWGSENAPKVTIVGKGICFDTGGLNIKPGNAMSLMKKDMGGAAAALAFAADGHADQAAGPSARDHPCRRQLDRRQCLPPRRRAAQPQRHDGRDRQHRCGGAPRAGRRPQPRRRGGAGLSRHLRHSDRRGAGGARARSAAASTPTDEAFADAMLEGRARGRRSGVAHALLGALRQTTQEQHRRCQSHLRRRRLPAR